MGKIYKNGVSYCGGSGGSGGTSDYTELTNKPQINGVTLNGNKTLEQLGLEVDDTLDDTSENPIQNKAVTEELNKKISASVVGEKLVFS